jgi:hypothetical protein
MLKSSPIFKRNDAHSVLKKNVLKKQGFSIFEIWVFWTCKKNWFVSSFAHLNFAINGKYSKNNYDNLNYHASFVIFQTYKNVVLRNVHSLGWLLRVCFYPFVHVIETFTLLIFDNDKFKNILKTKPWFWLLIFKYLNWFELI